MKYYWLYHDKLCSPVALLDVTGAVAVQLLAPTSPTSGLRQRRLLQFAPASTTSIAVV